VFRSESPTDCRGAHDHALRMSEVLTPLTYFHRPRLGPMHRPLALSHSFIKAPNRRRRDAEALIEEGQLTWVYPRFTFFKADSKALTIFPLPSDPLPALPCIPSMILVTRGSYLRRGRIAHLRNRASRPMLSGVVNESKLTVAPFPFQELRERILPGGLLKWARSL